MEETKNVLVMAERENKTVYRDGNKTVKVFTDNYQKSYVMNEAFNQAIIEELGINVPSLYEIRSVNNKLVTVSEYIEGKTLDELMECDSENASKYLEMFVSLQLQIHSKETTALTRLKDKLNRQITDSSLPATVRYDLHNRLKTVPKHHKVCHGDFNLSNVILGNDKKLYILDWSHATQGNSSADAAMTYLLFKLQNKEDLAKAYLELFCKMANIEKEKVEKWIPMVAASHSAECNDENEKQLLLSWVEEYIYLK